MKQLFYLFSFMFFSPFYLLAQQEQQYDIELTREIGSFPVNMRVFVDKKYLSNVNTTNVPGFLKDYKTYRIPFPYKDDFYQVDTIIAVCGLYNNQKVILIDANGNNDLNDDKLFMFDYDRKKYLYDLTERNIFPPQFSIDEATKLDKALGNETFINYELRDGDTTIRSQVFVEVIPFFNMIPNPSVPDTEKLFDYTFMVVISEHRKGYFEYQDKEYQIYIAQRGANRIFKENLTCYIREKMTGVPNPDFEEIVFYPSKKLIIGNSVFDIEVDPIFGKRATLILRGDKEEYLNQIAQAKEKVTPFEGNDFYNDEKIAFSLEKEKPTVLHFWGSWCAPCKKDMPNLVEIWRTYGEKIDFIGVAAEIEKNNISKLKDIIREYNLNWSQICDDTSIKEKKGLASIYRISSYPTYLLISNRGEMLLNTSDVGVLRNKIKDLYFDDD